MDLPADWSTGTVSTGDVDLQYYRTGEGAPIVLAHGMFDSGRRWVPLGTELADEYEVIAYDARGHGGSDAPETGYDLETRIADLVALIGALDLGDPVLLGHSMGAATVAWTAAEHPDLARGVVLVDPSRFLENPDIDPDEAAAIARERLAEMQADSIEERIETRYAEADVDPEHARRLAAAVDELSPHIGKLAQEHPPVQEALSSIACPTLILRRDRETDERVRDLEAADAIADGRLVHVPGTGHYVTRDAFGAATAELRAFLRRLA